MSVKYASLSLDSWPDSTRVLSTVTVVCLQKTQTNMSEGGWVKGEGGGGPELVSYWYLTSGQAARSAQTANF